MERRQRNGREVRVGKMKPGKNCRRLMKFSFLGPLRRERMRQLTWYTKAREKATRKKRRRVAVSVEAFV